MIGVLGNSVTLGVGVGRNESWPGLLQARLGSRARLVNRALRASRADLAAEMAALEGATAAELLPRLRLYQQRNLQMRRAAMGFRARAEELALCGRSLFPLAQCAVSSAGGSIDMPACLRRHLPPLPCD